MDNGQEPPRFARKSSTLGSGNPGRIITISRTSVSGDGLGRPSVGFSVPEDAAELGFGHPARRSLGDQPEAAVPLLGAHSEAGEPLAGSKPDGRAEEDTRMRIAVNASLAANILLLVAKAFAFQYSHSKAVLASTADSFVDIASQVVLALAERRVHLGADPRYPVGQARMEAVGVVACAVIMTLATLEVIQSSSVDLYLGFAKGILPSLDMDLLMYGILGGAIAIKVALFFYCVALQHRSDSIMALAEDHRNDILSNAAAILCGIGASQSQKVWWIDPLGGILVSLYIIWSWLLICKGQVDKIVGVAAPTDFVDELEQLAAGHHELVVIDVIRAYFFGSRFLVELEVVMPADMTVRESHDIALELQHKVENMESVERAFVHVDHTRRDEPEHKVDYNLRHHRGLLEPLDSLSQHGSAESSEGTRQI